MKRILIVEDEAALLEIYVMIFKTQKFAVYQACNGKAALEQLDKAKPDVIILDILMPVMGGVEFLETANIKKKYPKTKVLMLSNLSDFLTLEKVKKLGADKYLLKADTSPNELVKAVSRLLRTKQDKSSR